MKRPRPLLLAVLAAASLSAACSSAPPQPETARLTSEIRSSASQNLACAADEIPSCRTTGTRINNRYGQKTCGCLLRESLYQGSGFH
jgi:hypothetical protein